MAHSRFVVPFANITIVGEMESGTDHDYLKVSMAQNGNEIVLYHVASSEAYPIHMNLADVERLTLTWVLSFSNLMQDTVNNALEEIASQRNL